MCGANLKGPPSFGINPVHSETATWKYEFVDAVTVDDCKAQVTVLRDVLCGTYRSPHLPFLGRFGYSTLI